MLGVDKTHGEVYFTSTEQSPLERQVYSIALDGSGKKRLSIYPGVHNVSLGPNALYYMDDFSSLTAAPRSTPLYRRGNGIQDVPRAGRRQWRLRDPAHRDRAGENGRRRPALRAHDQARGIPARREVSGGRNGVWRPWRSSPSTIRGRVVSWDQVLAHKGFVVWQLDNRGSSGRGHQFESVIYHDMGRHELADQKEGIQYLISQGFVDPKRIGLYGWSYGGYMTLYTVTNAPGLIRAAIAGAPVTSWNNYDSIYTERYMGLPADDPEAYKTTSPKPKRPASKALSC